MLLRREDGKLKYDTIFVNKNLQQNTYSDYKIISGVAYEYAMMAKDDANLYSKISNSLQLKATPNVKLSTPNVTASFDKNSELVTLNFSLSDRLNVQKIAITIFYKVNENSNWLKLTSIDYEKGKTFMYKPPKCKIIEYVIKISDNKNKVSNFSKEARLIF